MNPISLTKRYKCAHCAQPFIKERLAQKVCSTDCARLLQAAKREKISAKISAKNPSVTPQQASDLAVIEQSKISAKLFAKLAREERKKDREKIEGMKTKPQLIKAAQKAFNAYIRARDAMQPCICCGLPLSLKSGATHGGAYDCGHYLSVGARPHLRFNEDNANAQRKYCNKYKAGNAAGYRLGLIKRIGLARVESLEADNEPRKYTHEQLRQMTVDYKQKLKANKCK